MRQSAKEATVCEKLNMIPALMESNKRTFQKTQNAISISRKIRRSSDQLITRTCPGLVMVGVAEVR
jgi:hypothetical protein